MIAHWALINGELSKLLECVLSAEEKKQLELFLVSIAKEDLNRRYLSSPAIDLCVSFLLRESKYYEAEQVDNLPMYYLNLLFSYSYIIIKTYCIVF